MSESDRERASLDKWYETFAGVLLYASRRGEELNEARKQLPDEDAWKAWVEREFHGRLEMAELFCRIARRKHFATTDVTPQEAHAAVFEHITEDEIRGMFRTRLKEARGRPAPNIAYSVLRDVDTALRAREEANGAVSGADDPRGL